MNEELVKRLRVSLDADQDSVYVRLDHKTVKQITAALTAQQSPSYGDGLLRAVEICKAQEWRGTASQLPAAIDAIRAESAKQPAPGMVMVPVKPTQEMLDAGYLAISQGRGAKSAWQVMLRAAQGAK